MPSAADPAPGAGAAGAAVTGRWWCEYALLPGGIRSGVSILTSADGRIAAVDDAAVAPPDAVRLDGVTMPGFANAHSHAFHRALRGRAQSGRGDFWTWRAQMYALAERLDPDRQLAIATAVYAEMLLAGYTAVAEFHYVHHGQGGRPYSEPNALGLATIEAARRVGIRLTLLDTCYLQAGLDASPLDATQLRFSDGTAGDWSERVAALGVRAGRATGAVVIGAAIHSVRAVPVDAIATVAEFARLHEMPLHAHVSEQPAENESTLAVHGCTPTALLARHGALSPAFTAVHATHLTADDVALLAAHSCTCCLCPTTERDLADGVGPSAALRDAGVRLSIGSDQHAVIDPFEELRAIELDERLVSGRRGTHRAPGLLRAGTVDGHWPLGREGGCIEPGAPADLVTVGLDNVRLAGSSPDSLAEALVFAAAAADVRTVIVGGRVLVRDGAHVDIDAVRALRHSIADLVGER